MHSATEHTSETHTTPSLPPRKAEGVRRVLNLLFTLHVSPRPLTTSQIVNDPEIGYAAKESTSHESRCKAFKRDRETLAEHGVHIREAAHQTAGGIAANEESSWTIDRARTHVSRDGLSTYDAQEIVSAIDQIFELHADDPTLWPLQTARTKLCELMECDPSAPSPLVGTGKDGLRAIWSAFDRRKPVEFSYRDARGVEKPHTLETYGMFTHGTHSYLVGFDRDACDLRTFRTDRIISAKSAPDSRKSYAIPAEFDITGHQFLPFDFSRDEAAPCIFTFPAGLARDELLLITQGRGRLEMNDEAWAWSIDVRDLDAAATFALEHAHLGMRAQGPAELKRRIRSHIEQAVSTHE